MTEKTEERNELPSAFSTYDEAIHQAREFSRVSGLSTSVVGDEPCCTIRINDSGPVASPALRTMLTWGSYYDEYRFIDDADVSIAKLDVVHSLRKFLLYAPADREGSFVGEMRRVFNRSADFEHLHGADYVQLLPESKYFNTLPDKLLHLGIMTAFVRRHMRGATAHTALYTATHVLRLLDVEIDTEDLRMGPIGDPKTGNLLLVMDTNTKRHIQTIVGRSIDCLGTFATY